MLDGLDWIGLGYPWTDWPLDHLTVIINDGKIGETGRLNLKTPKLFVKNIAKTVIMIHIYSSKYCFNRGLCVLEDKCCVFGRKSEPIFHKLSIHSGFRISEIGRKISKAFGWKIKRCWIDLTIERSNWRWK